MHERSLTDTGVTSGRSFKSSVAHALVASVEVGALTVTAGEGVGALVDI